MTPLTVRLRELRVAKSLTQGRLAEMAGVTRATVNRLENARPASIDFDVLERLAKVLDVEPGSLIVPSPKKVKSRRNRMRRS